MKRPLSLGGLFIRKKGLTRVLRGQVRPFFKSTELLRFS